MERMETIPQLAGDHAWTETAHTDPTCTAPGSASYVCSRCSETKTDTLPALDHAWSETGRTDATCTDPGSIQYACSRCDFARSEKIPALGSAHIWEETARVEPTEDASGFVSYTCSACGSSRTEPLPPLGLDLSLSALLERLGLVFSACLGWVGALTDVVVRHPILLISVVIGLIGVSVLMLRRLLKL